jgi:hypothetical protein
MGLGGGEDMEGGGTSCHPISFFTLKSNEPCLKFIHTSLL